MPYQTYQSIIVTGVNPDDRAAEIVQAHTLAIELFESGLVSALSPIGHNFGQSFCVFPSWSGNLRDEQLRHRDGMQKLCEWLSGTALDFVQTYWTDDEAPAIVHSHEDRQLG